MRIAIVGYGKMGRMIERIAEARGHEVIARFDVDNNRGGEGEFSTPETAVENLRRLIELRIPVVAGATGWYARLDEIKKLAAESGGQLVFSSNFSIGMNLFFRVVREASMLFARHDQYDPFLVEAHHKFKKDAPSGTALIIAKLMRESYGDRAPEAVAVRAGHIPGTHEVGFDSEADTITLTHTARSREGFAAGAVLAAEKIVNKQGVYEFSELLFS
jgi:4-hydroxy-tetrahydrodipicolinate reductase